MRWMKAFVLVMTLFLVACGGEIESNMSKEVGDFEFTTQDNETLGLDDLKGDWWIADFIFTNCTSVCIPMTSNMVELQAELKKQKLDTQLVSFSIDPDYDTPEVLTSYAESYEADLDNWAFLTGYDFETIEKLSLDSFLSPLMQEEDSDQITHGTRFFLINPEGEIIKHYDGLSNEIVDDIVNDLKIVL